MCAQLTFRNLDVSQTGVFANGVNSYGLFLTPNAASTSLSVDNIIANDRTYGMYVVRGGGTTDAAGVSITNVAAARAYSNAITLALLAPSTTLANLSATDSSIGVQLASMTGVSTSSPWTFDTSVMADISNNNTSLYLTNNNKLKVTGRTRTLDGSAYGVDIASGNTAVVLEDLDVSAPFVSGAGSDYGVRVRATGPALKNITANRRSYGVFADNGVAIDTLTADFCLTGAYVSNAGASTLKDLTLTNAQAYGLRLLGAGPFTVDASVLKSVAGSATSIQLTSASNITVAGTPGAKLELSGWNQGIDALTNTNSNLSFIDIDASSVVPFGYGIRTAGSGAVARRVVANHRDYGVTTTGGTTSTITVDDLTADGSGQAGLYLEGANATFMPSVTNVKLTNGFRGLYINGSANPLTIGPSAVTTLAGNTTGIELGNVQNATITGLTIDATSNGVNAASNTNRFNTFSNLDVSRTCNGNYGLQIAGSDNSVSGVVAAGRGSGVTFVGAGDRNSVQNSGFGGNETGLLVNMSSAIPNTTVATGTSTTTAIRVTAVTGITVGMTLRVFLPGGAEDRVVSAVSSPVVTFSTALSAVPAVGTVVRGTNGCGSFATTPSP